VYRIQCDITQEELDEMRNVKGKEWREQYNLLKATILKVAAAASPVSPPPPKPTEKKNKVWDSFKNWGA
jgi:hypothetical protein